MKSTLLFSNTLCRKLFSSEIGPSRGDEAEPWHIFCSDDAIYHPAHAIWRPIYTSTSRLIRKKYCQFRLKQNFLVRRTPPLVGGFLRGGLDLPTGGTPFPVTYLYATGSLLPLGKQEMRGFVPNPNNKCNRFTFDLPSRPRVSSKSHLWSLPCPSLRA